MTTSFTKWVPRSVKKFGLAFLCISVGVSLSAAAQKSFDAFTGLGYYELLHVCAHWNYSAKSSVGLYAGTNFNAQGTQRRSLGLSYTHIYLKPLIWKIQPGFSFKTQYWNQDDENYYFNNISFLLQVVLSYSVNNKIRVGIEGGGVANYALETDRKQNYTVGYPTRWNCNGSFFVRYRLNKKNKS